MPLLVGQSIMYIERYIDGNLEYMIEKPIQQYETDKETIENAAKQHNAV